MPELDVIYYMAALNLRGRKCLVVGAGAVGLEKIEGLLACDALVHAVAPDAVAEVRDLASSGSIEWSERGYTSDDLGGCFLAIAATSDTELNRRVFADAEARCVPVNVVDVPELCSFILPAIVRTGPIAIAISTAGASPALAKRMKAEIAQVFGDEYARLAVMLNDMRDWAKQTLPTYHDRKRFFESIVNGEPDPLALLRAGHEGALRELLSAARERATRQADNDSHVR